jgi:hypothetical protein
VVLPVAVGDQNDLTQLHGSGSGASLLTGWANAPSTMHSDVSVVTVDGVIPPLKSETALFWVDVEGFEAQVLKGATNILAAKNKAIWVIEILRKLPLNGEEVDNPDFKSIFDLMAKSGYQTYSAAKTPVKLSSQADFDANPDVINFLFVDAEKAALLGL